MNEKIITLSSGIVWLIVLTLGGPLIITGLIYMAVQTAGAPGYESTLYIVATILFSLLWLLLLCGFIVVNPNEAKALLFFGKYVGTLKESGFFYGNPFYLTRKVTLKVQTFETGQTKIPEVKDPTTGKVVQESGLSPRKPTKVNDKDGTPIEIAAVIVWRIVNTAEALFQVDDVEDFMYTQSESALRNLASQYSYDTNDGEHSLRGHIDEVAKRLREEVQDRVRTAGVEVLEARISYLAYASEIAAAMLQRQQAGALIAARERIVEGAVGMVEHALEMINQKGIVELDPERKAAMVSNLLVVLCSHAVPQPVLNTGTLHN